MTMLKLKDSVGRFTVRKTLRFEMLPIGKTADFLAGHLEADEERAAGLNKVKAVIEAEHLMMVRRVFKSLPDPIPARFDFIRAAFRNDPEFAALADRNVRGVMQTIMKRCRANGWAIPKELTDHEDWPTLSVRWHWYCFSKYDPSSAASLVRKWAGRTKADVEKTCPLLRTPKKRKPSRNYWFDHSPFRVTFGNRTVGMNWMTEDFHHSRTFLLTDGDRIIIGITPRESRFSPYTLPDAANTEASYLLYEESEGQHPRMRAVPKELIDFPASRGAVYLFELSGRALRSRTNLNALYLRALLSPANFADPTFHLRRGVEFFARKGTDIKKDGKPEHFRQRFEGDKFFVSLRVTLNSHIVGVGYHPTVFDDLSKFITENPTAKFILVGGSGTQVANATRDVRTQSASPNAELGETCAATTPTPDGAGYAATTFRPVASNTPAPNDATLAFSDRGVASAKGDGVVATSENAKFCVSRVSPDRRELREAKSLEGCDLRSKSPESGQRMMVRWASAGNASQ